MQLSRLSFFAFLVVMQYSGAGAALGQAYPAKFVRIVTAEAGGGNDFAARVIAQELSKTLGQQVIVENRGGAGGAIAAEFVAKSPPDAYTLLLYSSSIWVIPLLRDNTPYDPIRDFAPITLAARSPNAVAVHPSLPVYGIKQLITFAKAKPGELNYGSAGSGATTHLAAELFKSMAKVDIARVAYKGDGPAVVALIAGQIHVMFAPAGSVIPHIKSGRLRGLAVTSLQSSALMPDLPTVAGTGLPGYESVSVYGVFAPAKSPAAAINRLNQETVRVLQLPDIKEKLLSRVVEPVGSTPEEFGALVKTDMERIRKLVKDANIRSD